MKKRDFARSVAARVEGLTISDAEVIIDAFGAAIAEAMKDGEEVTVPSVGKFTTTVTPPRSGVIAFGDHKGEAWSSEGKTKIKFKTSEKMNAELNA